MKFTHLPLTVCVVLCAMTGASVFAQQDGKLATAAPPQIAEMQKDAVDFLRNSQDDDGSWTSANAPGITALVTSSLLKSGLDAESKTIKSAIKHLQSHIKPDGGIYDTESNHRNYETCIAIMALGDANKDGRFDAAIKNAHTFLRKLQWDEGEGLESTDSSYGGAGYGSHQRPDMSNTQFLIDALRSTGVPEDDPAIQKALTFVSRAQNLESEFNNTPTAAKINDGGFIYTPANGGETKVDSGKLTANGGLRSYGSMTYAGLKSMIYAGVKADDKRVKAAVKWISNFYTLTENPGVGQQGLFYYYHTFAKALAVMKMGDVTDAKGKQHNWRNELSAQLKKLQRKNGSWVNKSDRWYEGDPNLSTAYGLLALKYCQPTAK